jgi:hypothetical protein
VRIIATVLRGPAVTLGFYVSGAMAGVTREKPIMNTSYMSDIKFLPTLNSIVTSTPVILMGVNTDTYGFLWLATSELKRIRCRLAHTRLSAVEGA